MPATGAALSAGQHLRHRGSACAVAGRFLLARAPLCCPAPGPCPIQSQHIMQDAGKGALRVTAWCCDTSRRCDACILPPVVDGACATRPARHSAQDAHQQRRNAIWLRACAAVQYADTHASFVLSPCSRRFTLSLGSTRLAAAAIARHAAQRSRAHPALEALAARSLTVASARCCHALRREVRDAGCEAPRNNMRALAARRQTLAARHGMHVS